MNCTKIVIHRPGGYDRLMVEEHPEPIPGSDEVLIDVDAIGVNYADCVTRMGLYASAKQYVGYPITPGFEVAGRVSATGTGIRDPRIGTPVMAVTRFGGYATQIAVHRTQVFPMPDQLSVYTAAGIPTVFITAWFALFELAHPHRGDLMLVHSAAGGVGSALVQLGKLAGCRVIGIVGAPHKVDAVKELGADLVIDKSAEDLWSAVERRAPGGIDIILDANGVSTLRQSYHHLAPAGKLVVYGFHSMLPKNAGRPNRLKLAWNYLRTPCFNPFSMTTKNRSVLAFNLSFLFERSDRLMEGMRQLLQWLSAGKIKPSPTTIYPFEKVAAAHRDLESGTTIGKLILSTTNQTTFPINSSLVQKGRPDRQENS
ncbi:MAG: zinc-binding dehydrogenase [Gammaproteobacteria bacterium]|nr:zinc-binding dehydrogenase [Gammaproteobacteria bacterium]